MTRKKLPPIPDFQSIEERDNYFRDNADYFVLYSTMGVGHRDRTEYKNLADAEKNAILRQIIAPESRWMIYAVIGAQSAFVMSVPKSNLPFKGKRK